MASRAPNAWSLISESLWRRRYGGDPGLIGRQIDDRRTAANRRRHHARHLRVSGLGRVVAAARRTDARCTRRRRRLACACSACFRPGATFEAATTELNQLSAAVCHRTDAARRRCAAAGASVHGGVRTDRRGDVGAGVRAGDAADGRGEQRRHSRVRAHLVARAGAGRAGRRSAPPASAWSASCSSKRWCSARLPPRSGWSARMRRSATSGIARGLALRVTLEPNPRIVAFVVFLTLLVGVVSGLFPALRVTRHDLRNSLHAGRGFAVGGFGRVGARRCWLSRSHCRWRC